MTGDLPRRHALPAAGRPGGLASREPYPGVPPVLDQQFDAGSLYALRAAAEAHASEAGMPEGRCADLVITVHELASNAVRHGAGTERLRMWNRDGLLHCQVSDDGPAGRSAQKDQHAAGAAARDLGAL